MDFFSFDNLHPSVSGRKIPALQNELPTDYLDRFSGLSRLYGVEALGRLRRAHVAVIGLGGVGSWAAEALARSGVGHLTLIDPDEICVTNTNRQLPALEGQYGRSKITAIAERLALIQPGIVVDEVAAFFTTKNAREMLSQGFDVVVDGIDEPEQKALMVVACRDLQLPLIISGGAAGKRDPTAIRRADLAFATNDRLLKRVRWELRHHHGYPDESTRLPFHTRAVYSIENARYPWSDGTVRDKPEFGYDLRLNCDTGFGSVVSVTGAFGFAAAAEAVEALLAAS